MFDLKELSETIQEKIKLGYPTEECCVDCYGYSLVLDAYNPFDLNTSGTRKVNPFKGKVFLDGLTLYVREEKNGKLLKRKTNVKASYKPSIKLFETVDEMINEYEKDKKIAMDIIDKKFADVISLKKEIETNIDSFN